VKRSKSYVVTLTVTRGDQEVELTVRGTVSLFVPARIYGPPEDCFPSEGGQAEITDVVDGQGQGVELTDDEALKAEELLQEAAEAAQDSYDEDRAEMLRDMREDGAW
jgi:hypothetical protein